MIFKVRANTFDKTCDPHPARLFVVAFGGSHRATLSQRAQGEGPALNSFTRSLAGASRRRERAGLRFCGVRPGSCGDHRWRAAGTSGEAP